MLMTGLCFGMLIMALAGCAASIPTGRFDALDEAAKKLKTTTGDTYARIEKLQRRFIVATAPDAPIDSTTFLPKLGNARFDLTPALNFREAALDVVESYTSVLSNLASKDYVSGVDKAAQELGGSLKRLDSLLPDKGSIGGVEVSGALATVVDALTSHAIDRDRVDALKKAMDMAQKSLEDLCPLITEGNSALRTSVSIMASRIIAHENAVRPPYATLPRYDFDLGVADFITEVGEIQASLDLLSKAYCRIPKAHRDIREALEGKVTTMDALQALVEEAQRVSKFYRNLGKD
jgi:hypothetical protein